jgi:multidrug efflux pump subunit AcrA (membrane-fusion protein)
VRVQRLLVECGLHVQVNQLILPVDQQLFLASRQLDALHNRPFRLDLNAIRVLLDVIELSRLKLVHGTQTNHNHLRVQLGIQYLLNLRIDKGSALACFQESSI